MVWPTAASGQLYVPRSPLVEFRTALQNPIAEIQACTLSILIIQLTVHIPGVGVFAARAYIPRLVIFGQLLIFPNLTWVVPNQIAGSCFVNYIINLKFTNDADLI